MRIEQPILEGRFLRRYKRFFAEIELADGQIVTAHCPNTGSLAGCLRAGARAILRDSQDRSRKLRYVWQAIEIDGTLVNVDTSLPNRAVYEAVLGGEIPELEGYQEVRREVKYGRNSRIDLLLETRTGARCYVEVKNTTLAQGRVAMFPDAVTQRGKKHLEELSRVARRGDRAVQLFFVSRADCRLFRPASHIDPQYARALAVAAGKGVELLAYAACVRPDGIQVAGRLPIELTVTSRAAPSTRSRVPRARARSRSVAPPHGARPR